MKVTNFKPSRFARGLCLYTLLAGIWFLALFGNTGMVIVTCMLWYMAYTKNEKLRELEDDINRMERSYILDRKKRFLIRHIKILRRLNQQMQEQQKKEIKKIIKYKSKKKYKKKR